MRHDDVTPSGVVAVVHACLACEAMSALTLEAEPHREGAVLTLTYSSTATDLFSVEELVELIEEIRPKNEQLGVTGLLLYSGGNVIQTLEGAEADVMTIFDAICADDRHDRIEVLDRRTVVARAFPTWSMGFRNVTAREAIDTLGYAAFVKHSLGRDLDAHPEPAFELLERFRRTAV